MNGSCELFVAFNYIVAHEAECLAEIEAGLGQMIDQCGGEWTVLAITVRCKSNRPWRAKAIIVFGLDGSTSQALVPTAPCGDCSFHRLGKRIVAARIQG